jgi:hypothetical protein
MPIWEASGLPRTWHFCYFTSLSLQWLQKSALVLAMNVIACDSRIVSATPGLDLEGDSFFHWFYSPLGSWPLVFQFHGHFIDGRTPWTSDQLVVRSLPKHRTTQTQNKRTQTSILWVGFEPPIPASKRAKRVHALDSSATETFPEGDYWPRFAISTPLHTWVST